MVASRDGNGLVVCDVAAKNSGPRSMARPLLLNGSAMAMRRATIARCAISSHLVLHPLVSFLIVSEGSMKAGKLNTLVVATSIVVTAAVGHASAAGTSAT